MENKKRGRPRKHFTEEDKRRVKTRCMLEKKWYCNECNNGRNYTLAGKWIHFKSKKHIKNAENNIVQRIHIRII